MTIVDQLILVHALFAKRPKRFHHNNSHNEFPPTYATIHHFHVPDDHNNQAIIIPMFLPLIAPPNQVYPAAPVYPMAHSCPRQSKTWIQYISIRQQSSQVQIERKNHDVEYHVRSLRTSQHMGHCMMQNRLHSQNSPTVLRIS